MRCQVNMCARACVPVCDYLASNIGSHFSLKRSFHGTQVNCVDQDIIKTSHNFKCFEKKRENKSYTNTVKVSISLDSNQPTFCWPVLGQK